MLFNPDGTGAPATESHRQMNLARYDYSTALPTHRIYSLTFKDRRDDSASSICAWYSDLSGKHRPAGLMTITTAPMETPAHRPAALHADARSTEVVRRFGFKAIRNTNRKLTDTAESRHAMACSMLPTGCAPPNALSVTYRR